MLTFINTCGTMLRFDHLYTLGPEFQQVGEDLPAPKVDDSSSQPIQNGPQFKAGDIVATAVGFPKANNVSVDFGVYNLRTRNDISKNAQWAVLHADEKEQAYYGVCWFDMLPGADSERIKTLIKKDQPPQNISDYCETSGGTTMQYNQGRPTQN